MITLSPGASWTELLASILTKITVLFCFFLRLFHASLLELTLVGALQEQHWVDTKLLESAKHSKDVLSVSEVSPLLLVHGEQDPVDLLLDLAQRNPDHQICLEGKLVAAERSAQRLSTHQLEYLFLRASQKVRLVSIFHSLNQLKCVSLKCKFTSFIQTVLDRVCEVLFEICHCSEETILDQVKEAVELLKLVLNWSSCQDDLVSLHRKGLECLSELCPHVLGSMSFVNDKHVPAPPHLGC